MMKVLKKMLAVAVSVATMAMSVSAFAATYDVDTTSVTMTEEELKSKVSTESGQMTVVVVPKNLGGASITESDIYYINQEEFGTEFNKIIGNMGLCKKLPEPYTEENVNGETEARYEVRIGGTNLAAPVTFDITVEGGEVTIIYGDADGDKIITTGDAILILQKVADPNKVVEAGADADGDTTITTGDAILVLQKVADPNKVLGPSAN